MELTKRVKSKVKRDVTRRLHTADRDEVTQLRASVESLQAEVKQLRRRMKGLNNEVQETRSLHERVAELTDAVAELLVPALDREDERVAKALATFNRDSFDQS